MSHPETETRALVAPVETRAADGKTTVAGYAAIFNEATQIGDWFSEVIAPGAFSDSIMTDDVRAFFDHDPGRVLGRKSTGTLRLLEDSRGLSVEIDLPNTTDGNDVRELISRGDVSGMSFGFRVLKEQWDETGNMPKRTILQVQLIEVSPVSMPAYDGTSIALRSLQACRTAGIQQFKAADFRRALKAKHIERFAQ